MRAGKSKLLQSNLGETMDETFDQLYQEIKHGRLAAVEAFLNQDGDPNLTNRSGWTLLMSAAFKGNSRIVTLLLDRKANINSLNVAGESALSIAAGGGHQKCVRILLEHGADIHVRPLGQPLLAFMKYARHPSEVVNELLIKAGAK
jgi:ankyrin repeat protein